MRIKALLIALALVAPSAMAEKVRFIYQEKSLYRNILVMEWNGMRCMQFGRIHAQQTCISLTEPDHLVLDYAKGLLTGLYVTPKPKRVLMLGLGGGVIPRALRALSPDLQIDSVELDPAVIKVAKSYFLYEEDARSKAYVSDARIFARKQQRKGIQYDIIMIDAFEKDYIPEHLLTVEFLSEVKAILAPGGVVTANTFAQGALEFHEAATYQAVFGETYVVSMDGGNRIIMAGKDGLPPKFTMKANADALDDAFSSIFGIEPGHLYERLGPQPKAVNYRVLTDQYSPANLLLFQGR